VLVKIPFAYESEVTTTSGRALVLCVVALAEADCAEALPAASRAETVKEYVVLAASPVIDTEVLEGDTTSVPSRYTR
jgi:hypothetical protein